MAAIHSQLSMAIRASNVVEGLRAEGVRGASLWPDLKFFGILDAFSMFGRSGCKEEWHA
jgi:hypothetical protein